MKQSLCEHKLIPIKTKAKKLVYQQKVMRKTFMWSLKKEKNADGDSGCWRPVNQAFKTAAGILGVKCFRSVTIDGLTAASELAQKCRSQHLPGLLTRFAARIYCGCCHAWIITFILSFSNLKHITEFYFFRCIQLRGNDTV